MNPDHSTSDVRHSTLAVRVLVMGLGRFGGGVGVTRYLVQRGATVTVTDTDTPEHLAASVAQLADLPPGRVTLRLGEHRVEDFTAADLVVVNPAVKPDNPFVAAARAAGVPITSEIRLLVAELRARGVRVVGVTGTAGKSTTTAMIGHILRCCRLPSPLGGGWPVREPGEGASSPHPFTAAATRHPLPNPLPEGEGAGAPVPAIHLGGNIGGSLLPTVDDIAARDVVVLELSSFMLHGLRDDGWSPHVAVVTNDSPNHLDWHGTFEAYAHDKQAILDFQGPADRAVLGTPLPPGLITPRTTRVVWLDGLETFVHTGPVDLLVPGEHNRANAALAIEACAALGVERRAAAAALADFAGLPHRLQLVAEHQGVRFFNDSKSTTPEAARLAIDAFADAAAPGAGPGVHLILGGYDKGSDLAPLARHAAARCRAVYCIGATGPALAAAAATVPPPHADIVPSGTLEQAMLDIQPRLRAGDVVVLSPGCASWDQFTNYEQRGAVFAQWVFRLRGEGAAVPPAR